MRTFITGGARSGKSHYAEALLADAVEVTYVATSPPRLDDEPWLRRIAEHRRRRPQHWQTIETTDLISHLRAAGPPLLIDCLTLWLTAVCDDADIWDDHQRIGIVHAQVDALVAAWASTTRDAVVVTNEVGSGVVPETSAGGVFRDELGRLNARMAAESDRCWLLVAGRAIALS